MSVIFNDDDFSSKRKNFILNEFDKKLSLTGGMMTGDLTINTNKIISTIDPIDDKHLARKKYVDTKLSKTGGTMTGDLNMGSHKIISTYHQPTHESHIITKKYVDNKVQTEFNIFWFQFFKFYTAVYEMKDDTSYIIYSGASKKILTVYNQTETENLDVNLFTEGQLNRPFYETPNKMYFKNENNFFEVPVNINTPNASSNLKDRIHIFVVYEMERQNKRTNDFTAIFGNKGSGNGIYRMIGFQNLDNPSTKRLIVYGVGNNYLDINPNVFPLKADPTEYNKMKCISVHYDRESYPLKNSNSKIFCNGKLIKAFASAQVTSGLTSLVFGGSNKTVTNGKVTDCFKGKIAFIAIQLHKKITDKEILMNHIVLCQKFNVDFDEDVIKNL